MVLRRRRSLDGAEADRSRLHLHKTFKMALMTRITPARTFVFVVYRRSLFNPHKLVPFILSFLIQQRLWYPGK